MMAAIALRRDGWKVVYLGADTPLADALALAEALSARVLGVSLSTRGARRRRSKRLCEAACPDGVSLVARRRGRNGTARPASSAPCTPGRSSAAPFRRFARSRRSLRA